MKILIADSVDDGVVDILKTDSSWTIWAEWSKAGKRR